MAYFLPQRLNWVWENGLDLGNTQLHQKCILPTVSVHINNQNPSTSSDSGFMKREKP